MSVQPRIRVIEVEEEKEITSKDLTKRQLLLYVLNDLLRGLYIVGCLFLDGLVILYLYSFIPLGLLNKSIFSNGFVRGVFFFIVILILEIFAVYIEFKGYRRFWPKGSLYIGHKAEESSSK